MTNPRTLGDRLKPLLPQFGSMAVRTGTVSLSIAGSTAETVKLRIDIDAAYAGWLELLDEKGRSELTKLYVEEDLRGHGIGSVALAMLSNLCRALGARKLELFVNPINEKGEPSNPEKRDDLIIWYMRRGFVRTEWHEFDFSLYRAL